MVNLTKNNNSLLISSDLQIFPYQESKISVPLNSIYYILDNSNYISFKNVNDNTTIFAVSLNELQINGEQATRDNLITLFDSVANGSMSGGGDVSVSWNDITDKPSTFAPSEHSHTIGEVDGLQEALDGKQDKGNYIEDVNTDGFYLRKKENWVEMPLDILETFYTYGIEYDITVSSPDVTRIGNMALHKSLPIHNKIKGCLLADDGTVNKYLDASDWTNETRDGSQGQVMIELPMYYRKFETDGNKRRVKLSEYPLPGYHQVKKKYISAYEATVERSTNKLCSVVNTNVDYRGGNNNAEWDGTYRSLLGLPATLISRIKFREFARNRNANTYNWNCMTYDIQKDIYWLFVTEFATLNSQKEINNELTIEGYHQGGLGAGATTLDSGKWNAYNNYYPIIPCGYTDKIGNNTGELEFNMPSEYDETIKTIKVNRYRGIENPFGHLWKITDGVNVRISPTIDNGGDDLSKVYICNTPANFNDTNYENYDYIGDEARKEGYVKSVIFGDNGEIIPNEIGGSSTSYFCDYHYTNIPTIESLRILLFGGNASYGAAAGFAYAHSYYTPSITYANLGSRLCFLPE